MPWAYVTRSRMARSMSAASKERVPRGLHLSNLRRPKVAVSDSLPS